MKKYTSSKKNKDMTLFEMLKRFKEEYSKLSTQLNKIDMQLQKLLIRNDMNSPNFPIDEYSSLLEEKTDIKKKLDNMNTLKKELKKEFIKVASIVIIPTVMITSGIDFATNSSNQILNQNLNEAYGIVSQYDEFDYDKLDLENIKNNPEEITQLALNTLKSKIASVLKIEDPSSIKIFDNSTYIDKGHQTDITIIFEGKTIGTFISVSYIETGETTFDNKNCISAEVVGIVEKISGAQNNGDIKSAKEALFASNDLKNDQIELPNANKVLAEDNNINDFEI